MCAYYIYINIKKVRLSRVDHQSSQIVSNLSSSARVGPKRNPQRTEELKEEATRSPEASTKLPRSKPSSNVATC